MFLILNMQHLAAAERRVAVMRGSINFFIILLVKPLEEWLLVLQSLSFVIKVEKVGFPPPPTKF